MLTKSEDIVTLRQELCHLEETYKEAAEIALCLRELVPGYEAEKIMERVEQEDVEIHQIKRTLVRIMATECDVENNDTVDKNPGEKGEGGKSLSVRRDGELVQGKEEALTSRGVPDDTMCKERSKEDLKEELKRIGLRLRNQRSLVSDLLKSNDIEMTKSRS